MSRASLRSLILEERFRKHRAGDAIGGGVGVGRRQREANDWQGFPGTNATNGPRKTNNRNNYDGSVRVETRWS